MSRPLIPAMGHRFDDDMLCDWCRIPWEAHQVAPLACDKRPESAGDGGSRRRPMADLVAQ